MNLGLRQQLVMVVAADSSSGALSEAAKKQMQPYEHDHTEND